MKTSIKQIQVGPGKILVKMWMTKELMEKSKSLDAIVMDEKQKRQSMIEAIQKSMNSTSLIKSEIVNLGPGLNQEMGYEVGKFVYVFPTTYDADFIIDEIGYYIYAERNILAVLNPAEGEDGQEADESIATHESIKQTNMGDKPGTSSIILN